ncbi:hypothetical protein IAR55_006031 [Kwoniella newhampshirensis]|uniref:Zn(2)-C6 fungal-type domain-containing protein n=1 Tax=Kwoniella newhampshirensis TaxID=1651941 RepID=A0AAW0YTR4_9TREE
MSGRKAYTCTPCRKRKIKCDRHRTCGHCSRKNIVCEWPSNGVTIEDEANVKGGASLPPSDSPRGNRQNDGNASAGPSYSSTPTPMVDVPHTVVHAEQLDHSILNDPTGSPPPKSSHPSNREHRRAFPFYGGSVTGDGMVTDELMKALPQRAQADALLRVYLERVEWIHHPLHIPTFLAQYNKFWTMDPAHRRHSVHSRWLALLYMTLCLGDHFSDEEVTTDPTMEGRLLIVSLPGDESADDLQACEDALAHSDFLNQPSTETLQTIICMGLYLNNKNRVSAARSLLGTAIKMAISMGMSLGRRIWWSLVSQDAYTASTSGFTYLINLTHSTTSLFANVDDEDIRGGSAYFSKPMNEITTSTYHIAKIDFALVVRRFIDAINANFPDASYEDLMDLDHRFRQVYEALPAQLRPDLPQPFEISFAGARRYLVEQRIFMGITLHNRVMRLHRAYMVRGYDDPRFAYSTRVCLDSAYALLDLVRQSPQTLCRWWVVLVHVWTGGLIISADLVRGARDEATRQRQRDGVGMAIALLEPISRTSPVALRGVKVLKSLLSQDTHTSMRRHKRPIESSSEPSPHEPSITSIAELEQLLREAASQTTTYTTAPTPVSAVPDQSLEFWQSLFAMNQW